MSRREFDHKVNRVEVIDANGRSYMNLEVISVAALLQDGGKTLKIVITEEEPTHPGWNREHFKETGCDGSLHPGDCLGGTK